MNISDLKITNLSEGNRKLTQKQSEKRLRALDQCGDYARAYMAGGSLWSNSLA
jgi:hypothetical protein